jgi:hypothetical protein
MSKQASAKRLSGAIRSDRAWVGWLGAAACVVATACGNKVTVLQGGPSSTGLCVAGTTRACYGPEQCSGAQSCQADGTGWGRCDCVSGGTGGLDGVGGTAEMGGTAGMGGTMPASSLSRSPWEMHAGAIVTFNPPLASDADPAAFGAAAIPGDTGWTPAPDPQAINYHIASNLGQDGIPACHDAGDFVYFRTVVCVPADPATLTTLALEVADVDDEAEATVFNSAYPAGVVASPYIHIGFTPAIALESLLVRGEANTIVITHIDTCCCISHITDAQVVADGADVPATQAICK